LENPADLILRGVTQEMVNLHLWLQNQQDKWQTHACPQAKNEKKVLNQIKKKLISNKAIISKADKGNSIVIIYQDDYDQKVLNFISQKQSLSDKQQYY
jgi:hypothetical protein